MATKTEKTQAEKDIEKYYSQKIYADESALTNQFNNTVGDLRGQKKDNTEAIGEQNRNLYTQYMRDSAVLPEQLARSGITGGAVESSNLRLMSDYRNNVAENDRALFKANEDIDTEISDLRAQYEAAMAESRAENELAKAQALEAATKPTAGLSEDQKSALEAYKSTGDTSWLNGYFSTEQINNMTKGTTGGGNGTDETTKNAVEEYKMTGLASKLFAAGYNPYEAIRIINQNSGYGADGTLLNPANGQDIWHQFLDWSMLAITNDMEGKDMFSLKNINVNGKPEPIEDVATKLSTGEYVMTMDANGNVTIKVANPQTSGAGNTTVTFDPLTAKPIVPGKDGAEGHTTFIKGENTSAVLNQALAQKTREDKRFGNVNVGDNIYIEGYGWMSIGQASTLLPDDNATAAEKRNSVLQAVPSANGRYYTIELTPYGKLYASTIAPTMIDPLKLEKETANALIEEYMTNHDGGKTKTKEMNNAFWGNLVDAIKRK